MAIELTISLPASDDDFGRWMERHGAALTLSCDLGTYTASIGMKLLISYSDATGEHSEHWEVSRHSKSAAEANGLAFRAATAVRP